MLYIITFYKDQMQHSQASLVFLSQAAGKETPPTEEKRTKTKKQNKNSWANEMAEQAWLQPVMSEVLANEHNYCCH